MAASLVTVMHVAIDWRAVRACVRHLASTQRAPTVCE
jgi:hypothetical protein